MKLEFIVEIKEFPDYFISTRGRVFSEKKKDRIELKPVIDTHGYFKVTLMKEGKSRDIKIHRLVCDTFLERVIGKNQVDHINRNKYDNRLENLHWVNERENNINRGIYKNNTSGVKGVYWDKYQNKWGGTISIENNKRKQKHFKTKQEAIDWRLSMEKKYYR